MLSLKLARVPSCQYMTRLQEGASVLMDIQFKMESVSQYLQPQQLQQQLQRQHQRQLQLQPPVSSIKYDLNLNLKIFDFSNFLATKNLKALCDGVLDVRDATKLYKVLCHSKLLKNYGEANDYCNNNGMKLYLMNTQLAKDKLTEYANTNGEPPFKRFHVGPPPASFAGNCPIFNSPNIFDWNTSCASPMEFFCEYIA